jgi:hypothetical protein
MANGNTQMPDTSEAAIPRTQSGTPLPPVADRRIPVFALGMSLGLFLTVTYAFCVGFDLLFPQWAMYGIWLKLLPGFTWLTWQSFLLGLIETFAYGWYVALVFAPLYNFFAARRD